MWSTWGVWFCKPSPCCKKSGMFQSQMLACVALTTPAVKAGDRWVTPLLVVIISTSASCNLHLRSCSIIHGSKDIRVPEQLQCLYQSLCLRLWWIWIGLHPSMSPSLFQPVKERISFRVFRWWKSSLQSCQIKPSSVHYNIVMQGLKIQIQIPSCL